MFSKLKFPSINYLIEKLIDTIKRFPFVLLNVLLGTVYIIYLIEVENRIDDEFFLIFSFLLGIPLFLILSFFNQKNKFKYLFSNLTAIILLVLFHFSIPDNISSNTNFYFIIKFFLLNISLHLLVSFLPVLNQSINGFWQYNQILFIRINTAIFYSICFFTGLSLALLSIDNLLNIKINEKIYMELWVLVFGIYNTFFFLSGIPKNLDKLDENFSFPKGLKIFTQYVLVPLVTIYLLILYLYSTKILFLWTLPKGKVSSLILGCTILGILSLLLVYPQFKSEKKNWFKFFYKYFFLFTLPLIVLLFSAIFRRYLDYGITENRYFIFVYGFWLLGTSLYFIISKTKNIKVIPISLCIICTLISFGPWGAFNISKKSQINRLEKILIENGILVNNQVKKTEEKLPRSVNQNISSILRYIQKIHNINLLQSWFSENLSSIKDSYNKPSEIAKIMGIKYFNRWSISNEQYFDYVVKNQSEFKVKGYETMLIFDMYHYRNSKKFLLKKSYQNNSIELKPKELNLLIKDKNEKIIANFELEKLIDNLKKNYINSYNPNVLADDLNLKYSNDNYNIQVYFSQLKIVIQDNIKNINHIRSYIFIKNKRIDN